jgi:alginate O-acetyltransferase complex protein AlgJ
VGRNGWLFLAGDSNDVLGQHTGRIRPGRVWELRWRLLFAYRKRLVRRIGATWIHCITPDKESVYAEELPPEIETVPRRPIHRLLDIAAKMGVRVLFPLEELRAARDQGMVYHQTDSHWTYLGAFIAYERICDELEAQGVPIERVPREAVVFTEISEEGDLGSKLDPPVEGRSTEAALPGARASLVYDSGIHLTGRVGIWERDLPDAATAVLFGTSYSTLSLLFLKETFRRIVFVHGNALDHKLIRRERPDVLITMPAERGVRFVPRDLFAHRRLRRIAARKPPARAPIVESWRG